MSISIILANLAIPQAMAATSAAEFFPENSGNNIQLDGVNVRKGTIGSFILNVKALEKNLMSLDDPTEIASLKTQIREAIVPLKALKIFDDLIPIEDMLNAKRSNGEIHQSKVLVAGLYLQTFPEEVTPTICIKIKSILPSLSPVVANELMQFA